MRKMAFILTVFAVFALFLPRVAQAQEAAIGLLMEIEGTATITRTNGALKQAAVDDEVFRGDVIKTGATGRAFLFLMDGTEWTLSENAVFHVDQYVYNPENSEDNKARYSVVSGAFRYVSGMIAKKQTPDIGIETPVGSIGIRGTDITAATDTDGGYDIYVDEGKIDIANSGGKMSLTPGQGTFVKNKRAAPWHPNKWQPDRLQRLRQAVHLKRGEKIRARVQELREKRKQKLQEIAPDQRGQMKEKIQERLQQRRNDAGQETQREERQQKIRNRWNNGGKAYDKKPRRRIRDNQ